MAKTLKTFFEFKPIEISIPMQYFLSTNQSNIRVLTIATNEFAPLFVCAANRTVVERAKKTTAPREQKQNNKTMNNWTERNERPRPRLCCVRLYCLLACFARFIRFETCWRAACGGYASIYERLLLDSIQKSLSGARSVFHFRFLWFFFIFCIETEAAVIFQRCIQVA